MCDFPSQLRDRAHLAELFCGDGVELGVAAGEFSSMILRQSECRRLWSVDRWSDHHDAREYVKAAARLADLGRGRCIPLRMTFEEAVPLFPDGSLDFVYIDGYAHTGQEGGKTLEQWWSKLKSGGVFAGHDFHAKYAETMAAVQSFAARHGVEVRVTGEEGDEFPSWWVVKPDGTGPVKATADIAERADGRVMEAGPKVMTGSPVQTGERVILVGNGPSMMRGGYRGEIIDGYDQVVRFNWYAIKGFERKVGRKTTLWSTFGRGSTPRDEGEVPERAVFIAGEVPKQWVVPVQEAWGIERVFYNGVRERLQARSRVPAEARRKDLLPSSGLVVALWLLEVHAVPLVTLVGFDHFSKKKSKGHHYWLKQAFQKPPEHDGEAEEEWFKELAESGRVVYL